MSDLPPEDLPPEDLPPGNRPAAGPPSLAGLPPLADYPHPADAPPRSKSDWRRRGRCPTLGAEPVAKRRDRRRWVPLYRESDTVPRPRPTPPDPPDPVALTADSPALGRYCAVGEGALRVKRDEPALGLAIAHCLPLARSNGGWFVRYGPPGSGYGPPCRWPRPPRPGA